MRPVVTPEEMAAIDEEATESIEVLIGRAAWAVAAAAIDMLDSAPYGKRVAVLAGKGNNGEDGRRAAPHLERRGARCTVYNIGVKHPIEDRTRFDLVIDACFGTGLRRDFDSVIIPISIGETPVLAVDIPSGVDGLTGQKRGRPLQATKTVTFAAEKPGLLLPPGRDLAGEVVIADIGLDCSRATIAHIEASDVHTLWPRRAAAAHKWKRAVLVIGGSPGMTGAVSLTSEAALRSGAGYVTQIVPPSGLGDDSESNLGADQAPATPAPGHPIEAVQRQVSPNWGSEAATVLDRHGAVVIGPGLPAEPADQTNQVAQFLAEANVPIVADAGALTVIASLAARGWRSSGQLVLTPHDGEFARLAGQQPGPDRIAATRELAERLNAVVLLKGHTTIVANQGGEVQLCTAGDERLATAGTGDVLSGIIGSGLAGGLDPFTAAGLGAELHGLAARRCRPVGMTAGDLPQAVAETLSNQRIQPESR